MRLETKIFIHETIRKDDLSLEEKDLESGGEMPDDNDNN
jgi:hypothetical protein